MLRPINHVDHLQWYKFFYRDARLPALADKVLVKDYIRDRLGEGWTVPTLWTGTALPDSPSWPVPYILKANHGSGWNIIVTDDNPRDEDPVAIRARIGVIFAVAKAKQRQHNWREPCQRRQRHQTLMSQHRLPGAASNGLSGLAHIRGGEENETTIVLDGLPLLLLCALAECARGETLVADTIERVISRADELAELCAVYWRDGRKPLSAQMKKGLARSFAKFDAYQFAKYDRDAAVKLADVIRLVRPKPADEARAWQQARQGRPNARLDGAALQAELAGDAATRQFLEAAAQRLGWSGRAIHRVLKVARTIADLAASPRLGVAHVAEAVQYRRALGG